MPRAVGRLVKLFGPAPEPLGRLDFSPTDRRAASRIAVEREASLTWNEQLKEYRLVVRIFDFSPAGLGLYLPQQLPVGQLANICWDESTGIQTVVRHCRAGESQFVAGVMHLRMAFGVELRDVSSGGLCCHSPSSIPVPMIVCLATADWQYYGMTRYCAKSESGYAVGIQVIRAELSEEPELLLR
jgi:hypothetical protein